MVVLPGRHEQLSVTLWNCVGGRWLQNCYSLGNHTDCHLRCSGCSNSDISMKKKQSMRVFSLFERDHLRITSDNSEWGEYSKKIQQRSMYKFLITRMFWFLGVDRTEPPRFQYHNYSRPTGQARDVPGILFTLGAINLLSRSRLPLSNFVVNLAMFAHFTNTFQQHPVSIHKK